MPVNSLVRRCIENRAGSKLEGKSAQCAQKFHYEAQNENATPKRAGVHVLYMQNRAGATDSGYFTSVASEMGTKSGWWVQNWRAKVHKVTKKLH